MNFLNQNYLIFIILLALLLAIIFWAQKKRLKSLTAFSSSKSLIASSQNKFFLHSLGLFLSFFLLLISWLRPVGEEKTQLQKQRGIDIVVALDVSDSMKAEDVKPNRLTRARREIVDLIERLEGDRVSLVPFAGTAFLEMPLTLDYATFLLFLNNIEPGFIPIKGTNIEAALEKSLDAFSIKEKSLKSKQNLKSNRSRAILIVTDGEDFSGNWNKLKKRAKDTGTKIFILGVGTKNGAKIPERLGFKLDRNGQVVITKINEKALKSLAQNTGGKYISAISSDSDTLELYDEGLKNIIEADFTEEMSSKQYEEYYFIPLALGLFMWLLSEIFRKFYFSKKYKQVHIASLLLISIFLKTNIAEAQNSNSLLQEKNALQNLNKGEFEKSYQDYKKLLEKNPSSSRILLGAGSSSFRLGKFEEASKYFQKSAELEKNSEKKSKALYNAANSLAQMEKYQEAVDLYNKAKELGGPSSSGDKEINENLKYVKKLIEEKNEEKEKKENQDSKEENEEENKENQDQDKKTDSDNNKQEEKNSDKQDNQSSENQEESEQQKDDPEQSSQESQGEDKEDSQSEESEGDEPSAPEDNENDKSSQDSGEPNDDNSEDQDGKEHKLNYQPQVSDQYESLLEAIKENPKIRAKIRAHQAIKEMREKGIRKPLKDW